MVPATYDTPNALSPLQHVSTPVWVFDVDRHAIWWGNQAALEFWGADSLDALTDRDFSSDSASVRRRLHQIEQSAKGDSVVTDLWTLYPNGVPRTVVLSFSPAKIAGGRAALVLQVTRVLDICTDEESVRLVEASKSADLMVSTFSATGELLVQNPAALSCYGDAAKGGGSLHSRIAAPDVADKFLRVRSENGRDEAAVSVRTQRGPRTHRILAQRGRDPITGDFVLVLTEEDVTDQARAQQQLKDWTEQLETEVAERTRLMRESEERYALATRTAAIWDWDARTGKMFVSRPFREYLGFTEAEFEQSFSAYGSLAFVHEDDRAEFRQALISHLKNPSKLFNYDVRTQTPKGELRWVNMRGRAVEGPDGRTLRSVGLVTDVQERKDLEASLMATGRLEAVGQLTGGIAHDFNNLLTVIGGNAELLASLPGVEQDLTDAIIDATRRGAQLTRHLLAFSRKQTLNPGRVKLCDLIFQMQKTMLRILGDQIEVQTQLAPDLRAIHADAVQVESAILNLALNARDAMPEGGRLSIVCRNITVAPDPAAPHDKLEPGHYVEIRVSDTGTGMEDSVLRHAFEPFFTTKEVGAGSGLGLSMVHGFCRQSGGDARIDSVPGSGTDVRLYLPQDCAGHDGDAAEPSAPPPLRAGQKQLIFLLEDDVNVQATLSGMLHALNYRVMMASTVDEAHQVLLTAPRPEAYLVDMALPGGASGVTFARELRAEDSAARVIFITGHAPSDAGDTADLSDGFLQKPFSVQALSDMLADVIGA